MWRPRGNGHPVRRDNHLVNAIAELMDVVRDLCRFASAFWLLGRIASAEGLTEQCADLLAHRARLIAGLREDDDAAARARGGLSLRGTEWTN
jgi:hypothetical protein